MKLSDSLRRLSAHRAAALAFYLLAVLLAPNVTLCFTERMSWQADATNVLVPAGLYLLAVGASPRIGRTVWWMFVLLFFGAFELVLLYLFGDSVIAVDMFLNLVTSNPSEMAELLGDMWVILMVVFVMYVPLLTLGALWWRRVTLPQGALRTFRRAGLTTLLAGLVAMGLAYASGPRSAVEDARWYNPATELFPVNVFNNLRLAVHRYQLSAHYPESAAADILDARTERPDSLPELYIVVIGETARAADWQLGGYERATNPRLSRRQGVTYYGRTMSESNTTHKSVPMLLTDTDARTFGDSMHLRRGLIAAFREAGYATTFISNQQRNGSFIDRLGQEAHTAIFVKDTTELMAPARDHEMLPLISRAITSGAGRKQLIVVHTYGSHFKYRDRYTDAFRVYTPDEPLYTSPSCRDNLINAYDNTILYTDALLDSIIGLAQATGRVAALTYVSDHGEDIFDDDRGRFLHASPTPTARQLHVPMLLWMSEEYRRRYPRQARSAARHREMAVSSSRALYPTVLQMAGITTRRLRPEESLVSPLYREPERRYLTDHNRAVTYPSAGFLPPDLLYLRLQ